MDYESLTEYLDQEHCKQQGVLAYEDWLLTPEPAPQPKPKPTCGQCEHYQSPRLLKSGKQTWGYCQLRAQADIHPCNMAPFDKHAERCNFYAEAVEF